MTIVLLNPPESRKFHSWRIDELYWGGVGANGTLYRPRVGDEVTDWNEGKYRVKAVSSEGIPTLERKLTFLTEGSYDPDSVSLITASTQYQPSIATPIFFDENTSPYYTCTVDTRFPALGLDSEYMIFFRGTDVSENGEIISAVFDSNGDLETVQIPLIAIDPTRPAVKRPVPFHTTTRLTPGEIITGVMYSNNSGPSSRTSFVVEESAAIRSADLAGVFIEDIRIVSSLLDPNDDTLILNDQGTAFSTSLLEAELKYSNGATSAVSIDGNKCTIHGWDRFDTSALVAPTRVVLMYYPEPNEPAINLGGVGGSYISKVYRIQNVSDIDTFGLKVYPIPEYRGLSDGWVLTWRLTSLGRDVDIDVTNEISVLRDDGQAFTGTDYSVKQELNIALDMDSVIPNVYGGYVHTQVIDITVNIPSGNVDPFTIDFLGDGINIYGAGLHASASSGTNGQINLSCGKNTANEWISYVYNSISPLFDRSLGNTPPAPTHFRFEYDGTVSAEFPVADFNNNFTKPAGINQFIANETVNIVWLLDNAGQYDIMAISPLLVKLDL